MRRARLALVAALALAIPATAHAAIVPGKAIDGPSADVVQFGDIDMAADGTGALAYTKKIAGVNHIFVSRFANGAWGPGQQADVGLPDPSQFPHVAAGNGGRAVVTFVNKPVAGFGSLRAALAPNSASGFTVASPDATTDTLVADSDVAMDPVSGVAYTVFTAANMGGDVHAARLSGTTWTPIAPVLDDVQADDAGGTGRDTGARVAVDSAGNAVAAWPEKDAGMHAHVFVRRITGTTPATSDVEASIPTLDGHADAQASADHVDIDGGDTASPWVVFRQMFVYGATNRPRDLARQLNGGTLSTAQVLDGLPADNPTEGAEFPRIDVNPAGKGLVGLPRQLSFQVFGSSLSAGTWTPGFRVDAGTPTGAAFPVPAIADNGNGLLAWVDTTGGAAATTVVAREDIGGTLGAQQTLSLGGSAGPVVNGGVGAASSAAGNVAVGFAQGNGGAADPRTIVAAVVDLPQGGGGGGGGGGTDKTAPTVSSLRLSRRTFALGSKLPHLTRTTPVGTRISFKVSEASKTTFTFARVAAGRKVGKRCLAPTRKRAHKRRCSRFVNVRPSLVYTTAAGSHRLSFQGRLSRHKRLRPGRYRLSVVSVDSAGNRSKAKTIRLTVVAALRTKN